MSRARIRSNAAPWLCSCAHIVQVSDIYVRLGNGFELCVTAFRKAGISTS